jgi:hypothetical protein
LNAGEFSKESRIPIVKPLRTGKLLQENAKTTTEARHQSRPPSDRAVKLAQYNFSLERDDLSSNRHPAPAYCLSMIPRVEPEGMLFGIML